LFTPEVDATAPVPAPLVGTATISKELQLTMDYDDTKVAAIINQINGRDHTGMSMVGVPKIFGMNFARVESKQLPARMRLLFFQTSLETTKPSGSILCGRL
jgi:hypothetical protein